MCGSVSPLIIQFLAGYPENLNVIQPIHKGWSKTIIKIIEDKTPLFQNCNNQLNTLLNFHHCDNFQKNGSGDQSRLMAKTTLKASSILEVTEGPGLSLYFHTF